METLRMKSVMTSFVAILALGVAATASAQTKPAHDHPPQASESQPQLDGPAAAQAAVTVAERFGTALTSGDLDTVKSLLAPEVLILESGGAERSREEYLGHHAISDAKFLKDAHRQLMRRRARTAGDLAWIGSESELHTAKDGTTLVLLSTEKKVLKQIPEGGRLLHNH